MMMSSQIALLLVASLLCASTVSGQATTLTTGIVASTTATEDTTNKLSQITYVAAPVVASLTCGGTTATDKPNIVLTLTPAAVVYSIVVTNKATSGAAATTDLNTNGVTVTLNTAPATTCTPTATPFNAATNVATFTCIPPGTATATATTITFTVGGTKVAMALCNVNILTTDPPTTTTATTTTAKATVKAALAKRLDWTVLLAALLAALAASIGTQKV